MMKFYKILFFNSLILGTLMTISSYSWFSMWIGLEINLLSIIPLMVNSKNIYPSEAAMKYFITQALASLILLFSMIMSMNFKEFIPQNSLNMLILILNSSLCLKMGAAPFHTWFPEVVEGLNWGNCLLMLTWQKIAPMVILMYNLNFFYFFSWIIVISSIIGGINGLNQISLRKILAYSSINHIAWMLASMLMFKMIWIFYFSIYSIITMNLVMIFWYFNIFYTNQLFLIFNYNKLFSFFFSMNFLSLGGLPPFLGFLPKWVTVHNLINNQFYMLTLILIISTLITLYFYIRLTFSAFLLTKTETILKFKLVNCFWMIFINFVSLAGLLICTLMFNF
uniref:NADH-ubiquinone oxidoreductase chain 2 n=1 Tax=Bruchidius uberatus TaxID=298076 RepID=A0A6G8IZW6_9CUCU|nr:NADH dehydrogenase subunit 2 [Bruchidius uberatus]QIM59420.1 NADH dehydrogenase subunit 2 [Bruchidius uberatus]